MKVKLNETYIQIGIVLIIMAIAFFQCKRTQKNNKELLEIGRYTTGKTIGWSKNHRSSDYDIDYEYSVGNRLYRETMKINSLIDISNVSFRINKVL
jgi:hypothetical protein